MHKLECIDRVGASRPARSIYNWADARTTRPRFSLSIFPPQALPSLIYFYNQLHINIFWLAYLLHSKAYYSFKNLT